MKDNKIISKVSLITDLVKNQKKLQILITYNTTNNQIRQMLIIITIFNPICMEASNTTIVQCRCTKCSMA